MNILRWSRAAGRQFADNTSSSSPTRSYAGSGTAELAGRIDVYVARGLLVTSTSNSASANPGGVWLYATAAEHAVLYQYAFAGAGSGSSPIVAGLIQTEAPYWQPKPGVAIPAPFERSLGLFPGDDTTLLQRCNGTSAPVAGCDESWALRILLGAGAGGGRPRPSSQSGCDVQVFGAGLYSFFSAYTQDCIGTASCQRALVEIDTASTAVGLGTAAATAGYSGAGIWIFNLFGIGADALVQETTGGATRTTTISRTLDNPSAADMPGAGQHKAGLIVAYQARS